MFAITERLLLRPGWMEDAPALARAIADGGIAGDPGAAWPADALGDAERLLARPPRPGRPRFLVTRRLDGAVVGGVGLDGPEPTLDYWIAPSHRGHGYATEAARAVVALADDSLRLPRIAAATRPSDLAAARILQRLGFVRDAAHGGGQAPWRFTRERPERLALAA